MKGKYGYKIVQTPVGKTGIVWSRGDHPKIAYIFLPEGRLLQSIKKLFPDSVETGEGFRDISDAVLAWFKGKDCRFSSSLLDRNACYEFQKKVLVETAAVRRGKVITYGRLAGKIAAPNAARAVGTALGRNPFPLLIPCHRVVRSDGSLGGFGGGLPMKRKLLEMEGVEFDKRGRVKPDYIL